MNYEFANKDSYPTVNFSPSDSDEFPLQTLIYCVFLFASVEDTMLFAKYGVFLQPLSITSILLGLYGVTITMTSLQEVNPGTKKLRMKKIRTYHMYILRKQETSGFSVFDKDRPCRGRDSSLATEYPRFHCQNDLPYLAVFIESHHSSFVDAFMAFPTFEYRNSFVFLFTHFYTVTQLLRVFADIYTSGRVSCYCKIPMCLCYFSLLV